MSLCVQQQDSSDRISPQGRGDIAVLNNKNTGVFLPILPAHSHPEVRTTMNKHIGTIKRWRVQIFAITWLAYAAFYFTRKAFSVAKLGIAEDPDVHARQNGHGQPRRHLPGRLRHRPIHLGHPRRPLRPKGRGARRLADFRGRGAGDGQLRHLADLRHLHVDSRPGAVHRLVGAVQEHRQFLSRRAARAGAGVMEFLLRLRRPGGVAVRRLVGVHADRHLARGVHFQCGGGWAGRRAVLYFPAQQTRRRRLAGGGTGAGTDAPKRPTRKARSACWNR